jgi:DNA-binding MarR family transcriptional regulator
MNYSKSHQKPRRGAARGASPGGRRGRDARPLRYLSPLHKANRQAGVYLEGRLGGLGVSGPEAHVLSYVQAYGPCPVGELVRVFGYKKPTMTSMLDRLAERELITRELHPSDRRSFLVDLTPRGDRLAAVVRRGVEEFDAEIGRRVTAQDTAGFENVMRALAAITGVELRGDSGPAARGSRNVTKRRRNGRGS